MAIHTPAATEMLCQDIPLGPLLFLAFRVVPSLYLLYVERIKNIANDFYISSVCEGCFFYRVSPLNCGKYKRELNTLI